MRGLRFNPFTGTFDFAEVGPGSFGTIVYASTVSLDLQERDGQAAQIDLAGALTLAATNPANGRTTGLLLVPGASNRTITIPTEWRPMGNHPPASIPANKWARLSLECWGSAQTDIIYALAIQP